MEPFRELRDEQIAERKMASPVCIGGFLSDKIQQLQEGGKRSALAFCSTEYCDYYLNVLLEPDKPPSLTDLDDDNEFFDLENLNTDNNLTFHHELELDKDDMDSATVIAQKWYRISSIILMATSQYFRKCFESSNEQEKKVLTLHLKESEETAFRKLLEFMHSMSSPLTSNPFELSSAMMVAKKFEQHFWVKKCKEGLINRFKPLQHPELMNLPLAAVIEILQSDDLEVQSEDDVYDFTLEWALRNYPTKQQRREVLEAELGPLIRFHYMSYKKLVQAVTNYYEYFSREFVLKAVMTAVVAKHISPNSHFVERSYKQKPLMMSEELQPSRSCTIFLTFTRDECLKLMQSSPIRSMDFEFHDGEFFIQVAPSSTSNTRCFGLSVEIVCPPSHDYFLCTAATKAKGDNEYVATYSWEFEVFSQDSGLYEHLFDMPLNEVMRDGCVYFDDGKLYLQVKIEAIEQPRFRLYG